MYLRYFKHPFDFIFSLAGFILLFPIFLIVTFLLLIANQGNPFFLQGRPGKNGRIFKIIKFKTMNDRTDKNGDLMDDEYRLTYIGKFIRKTSIDEIPQLINVLKGDMSLIGPRPLLVEYLSLYNEQQRLRQEVKPGITGWAQVNGRNTITWQKKFEYDVWYVENLSFSLDCKIILMTIKKVFNKEGINSDDSATMQKFTGNLVK